MAKGPQLTFTIAEVSDRLRIGKNQCYRAVKSGQLPSIRIGKRLLMPVRALESQLANPSGPKITAKQSAR